MASGLTGEELKDAFLQAANNKEFYEKFQKLVKNGASELDIESMVDAAIAAKLPAIVAGVKDMLVNSDALHASGALWQRFQETTYEQINKVCDERGLGHRPPQA